ncbi:hypothetical protein CN501_32380 [Bacillus cereus]|nr:hypothetical protein CN501_32380 [Bacillus cereus]
MWRYPTPNVKMSDAESHAQWHESRTALYRSPMQYTLQTPGDTHPEGPECSNYIQTPQPRWSTRSSMGCAS